MKKENKMAMLRQKYLANHNIYGNSAIEMMFYRKIMELSLSRFKWDNVPDEIDSRRTELNLITTGLSIFWKHSDLDKYICSQGSGIMGINFDGNYTQYSVYDFYNNTTKILNLDECVPIWGNFMRTPEMDLIRIYARQLSDIDISRRVSTIQARTPVLIVTDDNTRLGLQNIFAKVLEGEPAIYTSRLVNESWNDKIQAISMGFSSETLKVLRTERSATWNECMTMLGINNANQDKKERLVADEVSANNEQILTMRATLLKPRQDAVRRINDKFGLNIRVNWDTEELERMQSILESKENDNGIHHETAA